MSGEILVALIGAVASVLAAWVGSRGESKAPTQAMAKKSSFVAILALGFALTSIAIALYSYFETTNPQLRVITATYTAHTKGVSGDTTFPHLLAPNLPDPDKKHVLEMQCPSGYQPISAWHEVIGSHPSAETLYGADAAVEGNRIVLHLRARQNGSGYSYVQVMALCSRLVV